MTDKSIKNNENWVCHLTPELQYVAREKGTEPPFTGAYTQDKRPGLYHCACCGEPLFNAATKFDSGSGWPSFYAPAAAEAVAEHADHAHGMRRVEVTCSRCQAHLGHVFPDGPNPTGLRYCINSVSLMHEGDITFKSSI